METIARWRFMRGTDPIKSTWEYPTLQGIFNGKSAIKLGANLNLGLPIYFFYN